MRSASHKYNGILLVDKPLNMTSHDVGANLRRLLGQRKIGHTGTLDPKATGLLVMLLGSASKISRFLVQDNKAYEARIRLGMSTDTYDSEGVVDDLCPNSFPKTSFEDIQKALLNFVGEIDQQAPPFSAIKIDGKALYKSAREGKNVTPPIRKVRVFDLALTNYSEPYLDLSISCGSGTYIRSLAHDLGRELNCGGYLASLRRTKVGKFELTESHSLDSIQKLFDSGEFGEALIPIEKAMDLPALVVTEQFAERVSAGMLPTTTDIQNITSPFREGDNVTLTDTAGQTLAIGVSHIDSAKLAGYSGTGFYEYLRVI